MSLSQREIKKLSEAIGGAGQERKVVDPQPAPFAVQIALSEYFERIKNFKADKWQTDFCNRLQRAVENRHTEQYWTIFHAEAQLGKTTILSQAFPAWLIGHDPLFRYALMMYNKTRSEIQSDVVINILKSPVHQDVFPDKSGWLEGEVVSKAAWRTRARREINDGQWSFNPVGLLSGLTGSGFDWLTIDDPYANEQDAFSATINQNMQNKYEYTVTSRVSPYSCLVGMFHRYSPDDFAGYLLDTGEFDYVRYASQADGDYIHDETGRHYPDPLGRKPGEYISPDRRPASYYLKKRKNNRVWLSMFQGRPSSEEGDFFNVGKIKTITGAEAAELRKQCVILVRAWDLAATEAGGDYSVGVLLGILADASVIIFDIVREQVDTAGRDRLQLETARKDGSEVVITVPVDVGAAGKTAFFHIEQLLQGYTVVGRSVSGSKEDRARNFAGCVNSGDASFADDSYLPQEKQWIKPAKKEMRDFPLSDYDDIVDGAGDAYNESYERLKKGLVVKNYRPQRNVVAIEAVTARFGNTEQKGLLRIPAEWRVYVGIKITAEANRANSALIVARAAVNARLGEALFVAGEYKQYDNDYYRLFDWIERELQTKCGKTGKENIGLYLHPDSAAFAGTIKQKLGYNVAVFDADDKALAGYAETNWYLMTRDSQENPFNPVERATGLYLISTDEQVSTPVDSAGLYSLRQEFVTLGYNERGEPSQVAQLVDCLRMVAYGFKTYAEPLNIDEQVRERKQAVMPESYIESVVENPVRDEQRSRAVMTAAFELEQRIRLEIDAEESTEADFMGIM